MDFHCRIPLFSISYSVPAASSSVMIPVSVPLPLRGRVLHDDEDVVVVGGDEYLDLVGSVGSITHIQEP